MLVFKKKNTVKIVAVCSFCEMTSSTYKMELVHSARFSWLSVDNVRNAKWSCDCKMTGFVAEVGPSESDRYKLDDSQQADHAWVKQNIIINFNPYGSFPFSFEKQLFSNSHLRRRA